MNKVIMGDTVKRRIFYISLFVIFLITRLWQLTTLPAGMHIDEAGMAYDAWCLANWGVDRHLKSWPVYLMNFSSGQSSLYAFLCAFLFRIFGYSMWMVRMPSVIFSFLTFVFGVKIAKRLYPNHIFPSLLVGGLIVIAPYFIMAGRLGLDCNLMLGVSTIFLYSFMMAIETQKRWRYFVTGLIGGILLYSYVLTYIVLPLFLLFSLIYVIATKKFSFVHWVIMAVPLAVLAFPLILVQAVNYFDLPEMQLGIFTITKMMSYRISEFGRFSLENLVTALRSIFVGDEHLFDSIPGIWNLYALTVVLFVIGFISSLIRFVKAGKTRQYSNYAIFIFWFLIILIMACCMKVNTYRLNGIFFVVVLLAAEGLCVLINNIKRFKTILLVAVCGIYLLGIVRFGMFYYSGRYTEATHMKSETMGVLLTEGIEFIEGDVELSQKTTYVWERGIFYAISVLADPQQFDIIGDGYGTLWNNYMFGSLGEIEDGYNYIVPHGKFEDYCDALRQAGFAEKEYEDYSVFYKK